MKHTRRTVLGAIAAAFVPAWLAPKSEYFTWSILCDSEGKRLATRETITIRDYRHGQPGVMRTVEVGEGFDVEIPGKLTICHGSTKITFDRPLIAVTKERIA